MIFDLALAVVFLGATAYLGFLIWRKLPLLTEIPDPMIEQSFITRPSRIGVWVSPVIEFFAQGRWKRVLYHAAITSLEWVQRSLLRMEQATSSAIVNVESRTRDFAAGGKYWHELKQWKTGVEETGPSLPEAVTASETLAEEPQAVFAEESVKSPAIEIQVASVGVEEFVAIKSFQGEAKPKAKRARKPRTAKKKGVIGIETV
jgi:hypothetical protein